MSILSSLLILNVFVVSWFKSNKNIPYSGPVPPPPGPGPGPSPGGCPPPGGV